MITSQLENENHIGHTSQGAFENKKTDTSHHTAETQKRWYESSIPCNPLYEYDSSYR